MANPDPARRPTRPVRLATVLLFLTTLLLVVGLVGSRQVEFFSRVTAVGPDGDYLVFRSSGVLEERGFGYLYRDAGAGGAWRRADRRSGTFTAATELDGRLLVCHDDGYSVYDGPDRVAYHELAIDWEVQAARADGPVLHLAGVAGGSLRLAVVAGRSTRFSPTTPEAGDGIGRVRFVPAGDGLRLLWHRRGQPGLLTCRVDGGALGEVEALPLDGPAADLAVVDFDALATDRGLLLHVLGRVDGHPRLFQLRWTGGRTTDPLLIEGPSNRWMPVSSVAASAGPDGRVDLHLASHLAIRVLSIDPATGRGEEIEPATGLTRVGQGQLFLWLLGLGLVSLALLATGLHMFGQRLRRFAGPIAAGRETTEGE